MAYFSVLQSNRLLKIFFKTSISDYQQLNKEIVLLKKLFFFDDNLMRNTGCFTQHN